MSRDVQARFHEEWLGLAQPFEGLVFSVPVLADAQIMPQSGPELSARFRQALNFARDGEPGRFGDLRAFFEDFLGYSAAGALIARADLPEDLHFYAHEGRQDLRPSFAIARRPKATPEDPFAAFGEAEEAQVAADAADDSPFIALVWDVRDDAPTGTAILALDKPEDATGPWRYPPTAKLERLLRATSVPIGFVCNGEHLRLVYAPARESTSHLTFRSSDMQCSDGSRLLAAFELLLNASRTYEAAPEHTLEGLLRESRSRQADVTGKLAEQVFEAVEILLAGFEAAANRHAGAGRFDWLRAALEEPHDHAYQGVLSVVLRLVFLLYAEDQSLLPVGHSTYARFLSVKGLYDELVEDAGMHPESMHHRFGAYGRLLALFRAVYLGVEHDDLRLPPRRGKLFDPSSFPFLEGGLPGSTAAIVSPIARSEVRLPSVDDGTVYDVLARLMLFEGQRLSYAALDVEQIGSVYESLMGYQLLRVESPAVRIGKKRVWCEAAWLRAQKPVDRKKWLKDIAVLSAAQIDKVEAALKESKSDDALAEALLEFSPGRKSERTQHRVAPGKLVLQPGEERRRSGSHYTPRSLTERIVRRTLEPLLACLGEAPREDQILALKLCDPAMGSGAFLVEVTRQLADQLVAAWTREGTAAAIAEEHGQAHLHARRLVAQRCVYGVDKNAAAVELAKLSLWLVTLSKELPFTFVDHALRHGDSLVGLDLEQIASFHWKAEKQVPLFKQTIKDALHQAIEHRAELIELAKSEDILSQEEKRRLLDHAEHATERVRTIADLCVGAFFAEQSEKSREVERKRRLRLAEAWLGGDESLDDEVRDLAGVNREQHAPFHWWLEFPEVFYEARPDPLCGGEAHGAAYMDGFVGNPPFAGKNNITDASGPGYLEWLQIMHSGAHGNSDLSAHFFRRAAVLLGRHGTFGLIATNTIAQGDTRDTGLGALVNAGWQLYDATNSMAWQGQAAVTVSVVHAALGRPTQRLERVLDGVVVAAINTRLQARSERAAAVKLASNSGGAFVGSYVLGMGFTLTPTDRYALVERDPRNAECVRPYLGGQELNSSPTQSFDRYVITFGDMNLEQAEAWPDLLAIVREKVKPERDRNKREVRKRYWWRFGETTPALYAALATLSQCIATSIHSKYLMFSLQPTDRVFSHGCYVFAFDAYTAFAVLQSRIHEPWARLLSSSLEDRLRYAASDCFDTFPFPHSDPRTVIPAVEAAGQALYEARAKYMVDTDQGLTKTYNALKDPACADARILELRSLHEAMDRAVLDAYGWTDLAVPAYCPLTPGEAASLDAFKDEVIDCLYVLNAERAREEQRLGLGKKRGKQAQAPKKTKLAGRGSTKVSTGTPSLPGIDAITSEADK